MKEAAKKAVALLADRANAQQHPVERHANQKQGMRREHQASFEHFGDDFGRARLQQQVELGVVQGANDDRHLGTRFVHVMQNLERRRRIGKGHHDRAGLGETGGHQRLAASRVAIDHAAAVCRCLAHTLRIGIEREKRDLLGFQQAREVLPAASVTADDHVLLASQCSRRNVGELGGAREPVVGSQAARKRLGELDQERCRQHGKHHGRQHQLRQRFIDDPQIGRQGQQHDGELAGLREIETGSQRGAERCAENSGQQHDQRQLCQHGAQQQ